MDAPVSPNRPLGHSHQRHKSSGKLGITRWEIIIGYYRHLDAAKANSTLEVEAKTKSSMKPRPEPWGTAEGPMASFWVGPGLWVTCLVSLGRRERVLMGRLF